MPGFSGGVGSSVGGAAGDNGGSGGRSWNPSLPNGSITANGRTVNTYGGWQNSKTNTSSGNGGGNGRGNNGSSASVAAQKAAAAAAEKARIAEQQRQQRIQAETALRSSLQSQLGSTESVDATRSLISQISKLGTEAGNAAALNKALLDAANNRLGQQVKTSNNNAIGAAQAAGQAQSATKASGPNTALYSGSVSQAVGTKISAADQAANAAEARRMGGYNDSSLLGRIGDAAKTALGGLGVGGVAGGVLGAAAGVYNNFISDRQSASSRSITQSQAASQPTVGGALAGMAGGALKGAAFGPLGMLAGAVWGGAKATGTAPTAADLKGSNPLSNGVTGSANSAGPGQTLANGQFVGQGNGGNGTYKPGGLAPAFSFTMPGAGTFPTNTAQPSAGSSGAGSTIDDRNKAGQSAFNTFLDDLRKRQMNNLLYTGAGWSQTSGTSLLGRTGGAQGAVGGVSGQIISQYGGGRSLLGGAWSF